MRAVASLSNIGAGKHLKSYPRCWGAYGACPENMSIHIFKDHKNH